MNIFTIAYYTAIKYFRNAMTLIIFISVPIFMVLILTGSDEVKYYNDVSNKTSAVSPVNNTQNIKYKNNLDVTIVTHQNEDISKNSKISIVIILLCLFYGSLINSYSMIKDFKNNTYLRLKISPASLYENIVGKSLGNFSVLAISTAALVIITKLFFKVEWGNNILITVMSLVLYLVIVCSVGIILPMLSKNIFICALMCFAVNFTMVFPIMVEVFSPVKNTILQNISIFSFHNYAFKAIINGASSSIILLVVITAAMFCISLLSGRRLIK